MKSKKTSFVAKVISDGRITIPNEIRSLLDVDDGDYVVCTIKNSKSPSAVASSTSEEVPLLKLIPRILKACERGADKTRLSKTTGLTTVRLEKHLNFLVDEELLALETQADRRRRRRTYKTTPMGMKIAEEMRPR